MQFAVMVRLPGLPATFDTLNYNGVNSMDRYDNGLIPEDSVLRSAMVLQFWSRGLLCSTLKYVVCSHTRQDERTGQAPPGNLRLQYYSWCHCVDNCNNISISVPFTLNPCEHPS